MSSRIEEVQMEIINTKENVRSAIESAMDRGEKLDELDETASRLAENANQFKTSSKTLRNKYCRQKWRMNFLILFIIAIVIIIFYFVFRSGNQDSSTAEPVPALATSIYPQNP